MCPKNSKSVRQDNGQIWLVQSFFSSRELTGTIQILNWKNDEMDWYLIDSLRMRFPMREIIYNGKINPFSNRENWYHLQKKWVNYMSSSNRKDKDENSYTARSLPSAETLKAEIGSRTICFDCTFFHVVVFHVTIYAPRSV